MGLRMGISWVVFVFCCVGDSSLVLSFFAEGRPRRGRTEGKGKLSPLAWLSSGRSTVDLLLAPIETHTCVFGENFIILVISRCLTRTRTWLRTCRSFSQSRQSGQIIKQIVSNQAIKAKQSINQSINQNDPLIPRIDKRCKYTLRVAWR
jgi:hypothetical protein